jgi:maltose alpha-D-glucosyltransferase/alpha-amylase
VSASFLAGYLESIDGSDLLPRDDHALRVSLDAHLLEKACYEIQYELDHRPDFVEVPIAGVRRLLLSNDTSDSSDAPQ